jgi:hypothetical protein
MGLDLRKFALRLKIIEMLSRYRTVRKNMQTMAEWKRLLIHPN